MATMARADRPATGEQINLPFIITASSVGTLIEWYDFYLYGVLAVFFSKQFFSPQMDQNLAFIASLAVFWTGFLVRPFGAIVFGHLGDLIGRKFTFMLSAIFTVIMVVVYMYAPVGNDGLLYLGIPLSTAILMKFSPMGPFMTELYPTDLRGTGQGFCYNGGRAIGSFFPTMVGFSVEYMPLGSAIVLFAVLASGLMILMLLILPETRGRSLAAAEAAAT